jgi:hypothetical protein
VILVFHAFASVVIAATGLFFLWLAGAALFRPNIAGRFLLGFAASPAKHYLELAIRLTIGAAMVVHAPRSPFPEIVNLFGWVLIATTVGLLFVPWRWHRRFAQEAVPKALRYVSLLGVASLGLGGLLLLTVGYAALSR